MVIFEKFDVFLKNTKKTKFRFFLHPAIQSFQKVKRLQSVLKKVLQNGENNGKIPE